MRGDSFFNFVKILIIIFFAVFSFSFIFASPTISFTQESTSLSVGEEGYWEITITNPDSEDTIVDLVVTIPDDFTITDNGGGTYNSSSPQTLTWSGLNVPGNGGTQVEYFKARPNCDAVAGQVINASIGSISKDSSPVWVKYPALNLTMTPEEQNAHLGDTVTWTIEVKNMGNGDMVNGAVLTDTLGSGFTFNSISGPNAPSDLSNPWNTGPIAAGDSVTYTLTVTVSGCDPANLNNTIEGVYSDGANNCTHKETTSSVHVEVRKPDIDITIDKPNSISYCGGSNTVTVIVDNSNGEGTAYDFKLEMKGLLDDWSVTNVNGATYDSNTHQFSVGDIPNGNSVSFAFDLTPNGTSCHADEYYHGERTQYLIFQPSYLDECGYEYAPPYVGPIDFNVDSGTVPHFEVTKEGPRSANRGETGLQYTLTVKYIAPSNSGTATVNITDDYPDSAQTGLNEGFVVTDAAGGVDDGDKITWSNVSFNPGDTWTKTITMTAPTDHCAPGHDYDNVLHIEASGMTDCLGCPILTITEDADARTYINQPDDPFVASASKTVNYIDSPSGVNAAEVCSNIQYTTCFTFSSSAPNSWNGVIFNDDMPHQSFVQIDSLEVNGTEYHNYTITNTSPLEVDLSGLDGEGAPAPNTGCTLCVTFTLKAEEPECEFVDFSGIHIPGGASGCTVDDDFDQGVIVSIGKTSMSISTAASPRIVDTCEVKQFRIDITNSGDCSSAYWDIYDLSITVNTNNHYSLITGDSNYPIEFHNVLDPAGNTISAFDPTDNNDGTFTWDLGDIRHHTDRTADGPHPYITFYMKRDCEDSDATKDWSVSAVYNDKCTNDNGTPQYSTGNVSGGVMLIRKGDLYMFLTPSFTSYTGYPEFYVQIINKGAGISSDANFQVDFNSGLQYWDYTSIEGQNPTVTGNQGDSSVTFHWDSLAPNEEVRFKFRARIVSCDNLDFNSTLSWCSPDSCQTITAYRQIWIPPTEGIITEHNIQPIDPCLLRNSQANIEGKNASEGDIYNVHIVEILPPGVSYVSNSASYTITSSYGNSSGNLEPTINGQQLEWDFSSLLPLNGDGEHALDSDGKIHVTFEINLTDCNNFKSSDRTAQGFFKYDKVCERFTPTPDSSSDGNTIIVSVTNPHITVRKRGRNLTKGTGWTYDEVEADSGDEIEWEVTYTSDGGYTAVNTVISDTLPGNLTLESGSFSSTCSSCDETAYFGSGCNIGNFDVGSSCTITYKTTVNACTSSPVTNLAKCDYGCDCYRASNVDSVDIRTIPNLPNAGISLSHSNWTTCGGEVTITITNNGATAINQGITDTLPGGYVYDASGGCNISFSNTPPNVTHGSGIPNCDSLTDGSSTLTWGTSNVDFIAPGETLTITFYVKTDGTYCDTTPSNDGNDPDVQIPDLTNSATFDYKDSCNNSYSASGSDSINPTQPDLDITITPDKQIVPENGTATWTITITNEGDAPANNIVLRDTLGDGFSNITDNQGGSWAGNVGTWNISGPISPGGSWSVTVQAKVGVGSLLNTADVYGYCKDQGGNNTCTYTTDEANAYTAGFSLSKTVDKPAANVGEELTYTLVAKFINTDKFKGVTLTDTLPDDTDFISATQNGGDFNVAPTQNGQTLTWDLGDFNGYKEFNYIVKVRVKNVPNNGSGTHLTNNIQADFGIDFDGDDASDATFTDGDSVTTTLTEPDLSITKSISPDSGLQSGDEVTITLTVTNNGDGPAYGINVSDLLNDTDNDGDVDSDDITVYDCSTITEDTTPSGFTYNVTGTAPACEVVYTSNGDTAIAPGGSVTFTFKVKISNEVLTGSDYINKADVIGHSLPPSDSEFNNSSYDRTTSASGTYSISVTHVRAVSKTFLSTSEDSTDPGDSNINSNPPVAIGEVVEISIRFRFPQGITHNARIYDRLHDVMSNITWGTYVSGTAELSRNSNNLTCADNPGNINNTTPGTFVNVDGDMTTSTNTNNYYIRLDLGDVTNSDMDPNTNEEYTLKFKVVVNNNSSTNSGAQLTDRGYVRFYDSNGSPHYYHTSNRYLHVAEPTPTINKTANPTTGAGGDTITFTLTICNNSSGSNAASAFDWDFQDTLPSDYENPQITNIDAGSTGATVNASFTNNTLNGTIDELDPGECVTITYTAQLKQDVQYGKILTNTATFHTTSLPGTNGTGDATPGSPGTETGERTGDGGVNDLYGEDSATVVVNKPSLTKDIENYQSYYTIGESPKFIITVGIPVGTTNDFVITDQLPAGLSFVSGSLVVTLPAGVSCTNSPTDESNSNFFNYDSNSNLLTFDFGDITANNGGNITIEYNTLVENVISNQDGVLLRNSATLTFQDPNDPNSQITVGPVDNSHSVRVGEPNLDMNKTITAGAVGSQAGDTVSWRIDITNSGHTTAYQVDWRDVLPEGLYQIQNAHVSISGGNVYLNNTTTSVSDSNIHIETTNNQDDTIYLDLFQMESGATLTITFDSVLMNDVYAGETLINSTSAHYTSLVDGGRDNSSDPGNVDDDDDSQLNNYEEHTSQALTVSSDIAISKSEDKNQATIGDTVTYTIRVDVIEGITPNLKVHDVLPVGLTYVSHSIAQGNMGMTFSNANYNDRLGSGQEVWFDFGNVSNPSDSSNTNDYFTIEIVARVDNIGSNQDGVVLKNGEQGDNSEVYLEYGNDPNSPIRVDYDYDPTTPGIQGLPLTVIEPDLEITKSVSPDHQSLGDIVTYTITVSHTSNSHSDAYNIEVTDTLPNGITFVDCSLPNSDYTVNGQLITFTKDSLTIGAPDNGVWQFTFRGRIGTDVIVGDPLTNNVVVTYKSLPDATGNVDSGRTGDDCGQANPLNDYCANNSVDVIPTTSTFIDAKKTVELTNDADSSGDVTPGDTLTYTITLHNTDGSVTGVVFTDNIPDHTTYVANSLTTSKGTADDSGLPQLVVNVGDMTSNENVTITFQVTVNSGTTNGTIISNQGSVDSNQTVPEPTDEDGNDSNGDQPTDVVVGGSSNPASMYVWKYVELENDVDGDGNVTPGDVMGYWVVFENTGNTQLTGVTFNDTIPSGLTYNGNSMASNGNLVINGDNVSLSDMIVDVNSSEYIYFEVTIDNWTAPPTSKTYQNQGLADSDQTDPVYSDGNGDPSDGAQPTEFVAVTDASAASPQVDITKSWELFADNTPTGDVNPGDELRYTITLNNNGSTSATNVRVTDNIPQYTSLVSGTVTTSKGAVLSENPVDVNVGDLNPGEIVTIQFRVILDSDIPPGVDIQNTANVTADGGIDENATATTPVVLVADLGITKADNPDPVLAGNELDYTIDVTNNGPNDATNVTVTDSLPHILNPEYSLDGGTTWNSWTGSVNLGTMSNGGSQEILIRGTVDPSFTGSSITNTATVSSDDDDTDTTNNSATEITTVNTEADLTVTKGDSPDPVIAGDTLTYTITVTNSGPSDAQNVNITDSVPAELQNVEYSTDGNTWNNWTGSLNIGVLGSGNNFILYIRGLVDPSFTGNNITNTVDVTTDTDDPDTNNNSATQDTTVNQEADLSITKIDNPDPVIAGEVLTYTITVTNNGLSYAQNVILSDNVPAVLQNVEYSTDGGATWNSWTGSLNIGTLPNGSSFSLALRGYVDPSFTGNNITNTASVSSDTDDPDPNNNSATQDTAVSHSADLSITKTDNPDPVIAGETLTYTITVTNNGSSYSQNVVLTDNVPAELQNPEYSDDGGTTWNSWGGTLHLGVMSVGETRQILIRGTIDPSFTGNNITNTASVSSDTDDPDTTNNSATEITTVNTEADLSITKSDNPDPVIAGETLTYTITVTNNGSSYAQNVVLTDNLPTELQNPEYSADGGSTWNSWGGTLNLGTMSNGESKEILIRGTIDPSFTGNSITNTASVSSDTDDPDTTNNSATEITTVNTEADLSITKSDNPDPVIAGETLTYTITVTNNGSSYAQNVVLTDNVPSELQNSEYSEDGGATWNSWGGNLSLGTLANGESKEILIRGTIDPSFTGNSISNTASVSSDTNDQDITNNSATQDTTVNQEADLSITKTDNPDPVKPGEILTYTITVTNSGSSFAQNVVLTDNVPTQIQNPEYSDDNGTTWSSWGGTLNLGVMSVGETRQILIRGTIDPSFTGNISNTATVSSDTDDPDMGNNSSTADTNVGTLTDLELTKSVDNPSPGVGDTINFTIEVRNIGEIDAQNARVTDILLPDIFTLLSATPTTGSFDPATGVWSIGNMAVGQVETLILNVRVEKEGEFINTARAISDTPERNYSNNIDSVMLNFKGDSYVDISVSKTSSVENVSNGEHFWYHIYIRNNGTGDATGVVINDLLPQEVSFVSYTASKGSYDPASGDWSVGELASGEDANLDIEVISNTNGEIINVAHLSDLNEEDVDSSNNSSSVVVNGNGNQLDLGVDKSISTDEPPYEGISYFTIKVHNFGSIDATNVVIEDVLPNVFEYESSTASSGSYDPSTNMWNVGTLQPNGEAFLVIEVKGITLGDFTNTASLNSLDQTDTDPYNNEDSVSGTIASCDPELFVTVDIHCPYVGQPVTFNFRVTNMGVGNADDVKVYTDIPDVMYVYSYSGDGTFDENSKIWELTNIPPGESRNLSVVCIQNQEITECCVTQTAEITYVFPGDTDFSNNTATYGVHLGKESNSDLSIETYPGSYIPEVDEEMTVTFLIKNNGQDPVYSVSGDMFFDGGVIVNGGGGTGVDFSYPYFFIPQLMVGDSVLLNVYIIPTDVMAYHYIGELNTDLINDPDGSNNIAYGRFDTRAVYHWIPGSGNNSSSSGNYLDFNGDGKVNVVDLYKLINVVVGNIPSGSNTVNVYDVNGDGVLDEKDILILRQYLSSRIY